MREKLIELLADVGLSHYKMIADHLIANGFTIPVLCQNCKHHDTYTCPENKVWCKMLRRYMSLDGYCSYGEQKDNE